METIKIIVLGASGRMGRMVFEACKSKSQEVEVIGLVEAPGSTAVGEVRAWKEKSITLVDDLNQVIEKDAVIIDFTLPGPTLKNLEIAQKHQAKVVIGTTGFSSQEKESLKQFSDSIALVLSPNMSVGVNVLFKVTEIVSRTLGEDYDIEVVEGHHKHKKDAPSGTAIGLGEAIGRGRELDYREKAIYGREGIVGARKKGEIGFHAIRGGSIVGDHTVMYAGEGERVELTHLAQDRIIFANGAVQAALFLSKQKQGMYSMFDVLGLNNI